MFSIFRNLGCTVALAFVASASPPDALAQLVVDCGNPFENAYGPFDYRTATRDQKKVVEANHFTTSVETLQAGITSALGGEIDYTLRAFPNHPRALMAMVRLSEREKTGKPKGALYPVECYLERAVEFRPDDMQAMQIRGVYKAKKRKFNEAIADFDAVIEQEPSNANAHYNRGLAYFEVKKYDRARDEAKAAQNLGFPLDGLKNKLKAAGQWNE
jgi:tetratricopeptide (TPR) repeat protein